MQNLKRSHASASPLQRGFFWEARTRILVWYVALMTGFIGLSVPLFSQLVFREVDARVREDLSEDIEVFQTFLAQYRTKRKLLDEKQIANLFQEFLYRRIPEDDTFLIAILDGRFYRSSPRGRPDMLQEDSPLMQRWANLRQSEEGEQETSDPATGTILYRAEPILSGGQVKGVMVAAHTTAGEIEEAAALVRVVIQVLFTVSIVAFLLAWVASGKVLSPLRSLLVTARSISETDLKQRIPIQGTGEMAELAATFNEMLERLQDSFTSQQAFINDAGHELRTPITIIRGHLELLGDDPQEKQETLELVLDELDRMSRLVDDLLLLAKSERPDFLQCQPLDISTFTQELYAKATALAPRQWQLEGEGQGKLIGDRQRLTQVIMNLAANAVQHTAETDSIALGSRVEANQLRLWVRDTGEGIAEVDRQRIFERFARGNNSRWRSEGVGLGLAIVKAIAEAHGGQVEMVSTVGVGSQFTLVLPLVSVGEKHESHSHR